MLYITVPDMNDKENVVWLTQWRLVYTDCRRQKSSRQGAKPDLSGCIFDGDSS